MWKWMALLSCLVVFLPSPASAQLLTTAQCGTLRTDITVTNASEFTAEIAGGAANAIAAAYALDANPVFWVWKTAVTVEEYRAAIVWSEVDALSVGDARIFEWVTGQLLLPINAADANVRQGIADAFGPSTTTRANLLAASRRHALRSEKLYATGTGSTGSPGTLTYEGAISTSDVAFALQDRCAELGG